MLFFFVLNSAGKRLNFVQYLRVNFRYQNMVSILQTRNSNMFWKFILNYDILEIHIET